MTFSIVVPVFNAEPFVERCAEALLSQTRARGDYEILMVDNNSTDRSAALIRRFDRIRLLHAPRQGSYAARNQAIGEARGEIIAFTDADCLPEPDWLEQIACAMKEPSTILVLGDRRFATDSGILGLIAAYESEMCARIFSEDLADRYYAYTNNMAVRTFALQALGGFRTFPRGADSLFMRSILRQCGTAGLKYAPRALVHHLEIATIGDYLGKKKLYGRVNRNRELATPAALPLRTRLELVRRAKRLRGASLGDVAGFLGVLTAGAIWFEWERWQAEER